MKTARRRRPRVFANLRRRLPQQSVFPKHAVKPPKLSLSDIVNILVLIVSVFALIGSVFSMKLAWVAIQHADASGDQMIGVLTSQKEQLDKSSVLLGKAADRLQGILDDSKSIVSSTKDTTQQLREELELTRQQTGVALQQVEIAKRMFEAIEKEYSKAPRVSASLGCWLTPPPLDVPMNPEYLREMRLEKQFTAEKLESGSATYDIFRRGDYLGVSCAATFENAGTANAEDAVSTANLGRIDRFDSTDYLLPQIHGMPLPPYRGVTLTNAAKSTDARNGEIELGSCPKIVRADLGGGGGCKFQFSVLVTNDDIDAVDVMLTIKGSNFATWVGTVHFHIHHPESKNPRKYHDRR
jgi:hypothetical protein